MWSSMCEETGMIALQVNLKMREIAEKEHKLKQHLLESPSHQKVRPQTPPHPALLTGIPDTEALGARV